MQGVRIATIAGLIEQREQALLQTDWNTYPDSIDEFLAVEFEEINSNGKVTARQDVVNWLLHKDNTVQWTFKDFRVRVLTDEIVLAIYSARSSANLDGNFKDSIRTSIWHYQDGQWKMVFHQATQLMEL